MDDNLQLIQELQQNSIILKIAGQEKYKLGGTRFGGKPDVPSDFVWPYYQDNGKDGTGANLPLSFLAQFNCADLSKYDTEHLLPDHGILSFFYETNCQRWGYDPMDKGCSRVFWFEDISALSPAEFPEDLDDEFIFPMVKIKMSTDVSYPSEADLQVILSPEDDQYDWEDEFEEATGRSIYDNHDGAHMLGWPFVIQDSMFYNCDIVTQGYYMSSDELKKMPKKILKKAKETAHNRWRLLLQLDTIEVGDYGLIYFYITNKDLKARRFDKVWLIAQSY